MRSRAARELRTAVRGLQGGRGARGTRRALAKRLRGDSAERPAEPFWRELSPDLLHASPVTDLLHGRLTDEDRAAVEARLAPAERDLLEAAEERERRRLTLAFAAHHRVEPALGRTGLSAAMPPDAVPSMARGAIAAGGSYYYADLVADALAEAGLELAPGLAGLDFGCSSGRVVRVLAAAHPELEWHGCDPLADAVAWASASLPGVEFRQSPQRPPLPHADGSLDFAFAISIWSHFSEPAALAWLDDMRRALCPGGRLLLTAQGEHTVAHTHRVGQRSAEQLAAVRDALRARGHWYAAEYGEVGDHGLRDPDWGIAFLTPEWLLARATPEWRVAVFHPGRVEGNQDLYVLERR
jgi:SAM-dependent methyltransferase